MQSTLLFAGIIAMDLLKIIARPRRSSSSCSSSSAVCVLMFKAYGEEFKFAVRGPGGRGPSLG
jgi:hypothetical protein